MQRFSSKSLKSNLNWIQSTTRNLETYTVKKSRQSSKLRQGQKVLPIIDSYNSRNQGIICIQNRKKSCTMEQGDAEQETSAAVQPQLRENRKFGVVEYQKAAKMIKIGASYRGMFYGERGQSNENTKFRVKPRDIEIKRLNPQNQIDGNNRKFILGKIHENGISTVKNQDISSKGNKKNQSCNSALGRSWNCRCKDCQPKEPKIRKLNISKKRNTQVKDHDNFKTLDKEITYGMASDNQTYFDYGNKFLYD